jgi:NAD dependent epimerase/dehydratase
MTTVLVTGAGGFIGSHLTEALLRRGFRVRALVHYRSRQAAGWLGEVPPEANLEIWAGDIRDRDGCMAAVAGCEWVFHLAALIGIPYSYQAPESYLATNVQGTLNLLQAARSAGVSHFLHLSTSEAYGTAQTVPITEQHPLQAQSPYSASKIAGEALAMSFYRSYGLPVTVVRPFNTYGPRQSSRAIIPAIITQLLAGQKTLKLGDLRPTRDLVFVQDTVNSLLSLAGLDAALGETVNLATQREYAMSEVVQQLIDLSGQQAEVVQDPQRLRPAASEVMRLCGSHEKLRLLTGQVPSTSLREGLSLTLDWFRQQPPGSLAYQV